jgi:hypothetical protein
MQSINQILKVYKTDGVKNAKKIRFAKVEKQDVYNVTAPFQCKNSTYILGRVEPRDIEESARMIFFKKKGNYWYPDSNCPVFDLQDPFITNLGGTFVLGGVQVKPNPRKPFALTYRTLFYKGTDIHNLKKFAAGPWGMKGIRLIQLPQDKIGVFTRPQGNKGRRGNIGFTTINSLANLSPRLLSKVELIPDQFARGEWGGVNEVLILKTGKLGILGHIARFSRDKRRDYRMRFYYPMVFAFDPKTRKASSIRVLVRRAELPEGDAKRPDLYNVVYPGGIIRENSKAKLYAGVGDAEAYEIMIKDPFKYYEKNDKKIFRKN